MATVPFQEYVRDVLPYEFGGSAPREHLEAGSVAVTSYAWYHVEHPYSSRCHLTDGGQHQRYRPGAGFRTANSDTAAAGWSASRSAPTATRSSSPQRSTASPTSIPAGRAERYVAERAERYVAGG